MMKMSNWVIIVLAVLVSACTGCKYMSYEDYQRVAIGESIAEVQVQLGRPYEVKDLGDHRQEYIYIERIPLGGTSSSSGSTFGESREAFRRYIFVVEQEKIIDKKLKEEITSPIQLIGP